MATLAESPHRQRRWPCPTAHDIPTDDDDAAYQQEWAAVRDAARAAKAAHPRSPLNKLRASIVKLVPAAAEQVAGDVNVQVQRQEERERSREMAPAVEQSDKAANARARLSLKRNSVSDGAFLSVYRLAVAQEAAAAEAISSTALPVVGPDVDKPIVPNRPARPRLISAPLQRVNSVVNLRVSPSPRARSAAVSRADQVYNMHICDYMDTHTDIYIYVCVCINHSPPPSLFGFAVFSCGGPPPPLLCSLRRRTALH